MLQVRRANETPFMVTFLRPGIGEIDMKTVHGLIRDRLGDEAGGIGANDSHVCQAPPSDAIDGVAIVPPRPLDPEVVVTRLGFGLVEQEGALTRTDFDVDRSVTSEYPKKIEPAVKIFGVQ